MGKRLGIGVQQKAFRRKTVSLLRFEGTISLVKIELTGLKTMDMNVPDISASVLFRIQGERLGRKGVLGFIEKKQLDPLGMAREDAELNASSGKICAERKRLAGFCLNH
jgi:hypothetical protein